MSHSKHHSQLTRRGLLKLLAASGGAVAASPLLKLTGQPQRARAQTLETPDPLFLITIACTGGASLIDGPLALRASEVNQPELNSFPDQRVWSPDGSPFRATEVSVNGLGGIPFRGEFNQRSFVERHHSQMATVCYTGTSVNHVIAQKRALTGNDAWGGRTIQEAHAERYGHSVPVPNVTMASGGYIEPGLDPSLSSRARAVLVPTPLFWPFGLHGSKGVRRGPQPSLEGISAARQLRDRLEAQSAFGRTFEADPSLQAWRAQRAQVSQLEERDLINRLNVLPDTALTPLGEFGLSEAPQGQAVRRAFPEYLRDPLEAQAALAYLLITEGVSVSVTIGPDFSVVLGNGAGQVITSPPLAFDFSHNNHRGTQALMWSRVYSVMDRLITLLQAREWRDGVSYWDRTMIHLATEFGRTRRRAPNSETFSSGHDLNNGLLLISPLIRGGRSYGEIDPSTTMGYGFDLQTGAPTPGREATEPEAFSAIAHALNLDLNGAGLPSVTALRGGS